MPDQHPAPRIAVVGSLMMDLVARVPRLPHRGESLFGHSFQTYVGGKGGNQALAAARLGARASIIGRVGADAFGDTIIETLRAGGVDCQHISRDATTGTGVAIPLVFDDGANSIISLPQANLALTPADIDAAADLIASADLLLVQFEVAQAATARAIQIARAAGVPILVNAAPIDTVQSPMATLADYLVVNEIEADAFEPALATDRLAQARQLVTLGPRIVIITLGDQGCVAASKSSVEHVPAFAVHAVDSVGAGDAFCAAFAVATVEGRPLAEAIRFANAAGAFAVTVRGAAASLPSRTAVDARLLAP